MEANEYHIAVVNNLTHTVGVYHSTNGDYVGVLPLEEESPVSSDLVGHLFFVGFKQSIAVLDLQVLFFQCFFPKTDVDDLKL